MLACKEASCVGWVAQGRTQVPCAEPDGKAYLHLTLYPFDHEHSCFVSLGLQLLWGHARGTVAAGAGRSFVLLRWEVFKLVF